VGAIASLVAATTGLILLLSALKLRRAPIEIDFRVEAVDEPGGGRKYEPTIWNSGSRPVRLQASLYVQGWPWPVDETSVFTLAPGASEPTPLWLSPNLFSRVDAGARVSVHVRYGLWLSRFAASYQVSERRMLEGRWTILRDILQLGSSLEPSERDAVATALLSESTEADSQLSDDARRLHHGVVVRLESGDKPEHTHELRRRVEAYVRTWLI
jgi:hypothetical protein